MVLEVNGVDLTSYLVEGGYKYTLNDVDKSSGRTLDGTMWRQRVGQKVKLELTCRQLTTEELSVVLNAIDPQFVTVTFVDPKYGGTRTAEFYSNNKPATCLVQLSPGVEKWSSVSFPLIER